MIPDKNSTFKPLSEIDKYIDSEKYYCTGVVFSPETENNHFYKCPPYIEINEVNDFEENNTLYFEVPEIIAHYAGFHCGYTMQGRRDAEDRGRHMRSAELKKLLDIS